MKEEFSHRLKRARGIKGYSQDEMAKFLNVPKRTLQNWESSSMDKGSVTANVQGVMLKIEDIEAEEIRRKMPIAQSEQGLALKLSALENRLQKLQDIVMELQQQVIKMGAS